MKNKVELLGHYGGDKEHAMSAWTSTTRDYEKKKERMPQLLKMLAENGHETPFEKSGLHFLVDTEIASHIHILKHRIGVSVNGESARYKEIREDKFFIPKDWPVEWKELLVRYNEEGNTFYHKCIEDLTPTLGRKRAKESARFFKTYSSQISADIMFNFRSFVHFQRLRNSEHAQIEIKDIADEMLYLVKNIKGNPFKHTLKAFGL
jgi:flavin-dependent thymidylate synthase